MLKKSLGQHLLKNIDILNALVNAADIKPGDLVVEVGPGTGTLTDQLLATGAHIIAVEKDDAFARQLEIKYKGQNIEIINSDILKFDPSLKIQNLKFKIIGNIPYYLTSHLIRTILTTWQQPELIVFMVQKEVARRMTAKPPEMNMLAVLVQLYSKPEIVRIVKRGSFIPPPKVDSAIVRLYPSPPPFTVKGGAGGILKIAEMGFRQKRKKLSNNLPLELLEKAKIDPDRRAQTLSLDEWITLAQ